MSENKKSIKNKNIKGNRGDFPPAAGDSTKPAAATQGRRGQQSSSEPIKNVVPSSRSMRFIHQIMPFIIIMVALFIAASYIFVAAGAVGDVGIVGQIMNGIFCGMFGWPAYFLPLVLLNLAIFWRKYVDMELTGLKITLSFLFMLAVSGLVHVVTIKNSGSAGFIVSDLWRDGVALRGGGFLGGLLGEISFRGLGIVGSLIVLIPLIFVLFIFLVGTTPRGMGLYIRRKLADWSERQRIAQKEAEERYAEEGDDQTHAAEGKGAKKNREKAEKKKKDKMKKRHEALAETEDPLRDTVFTEGHKPLVGNLREPDTAEQAPVPDINANSHAERTAAAPSEGSPDKGSGGKKEKVTTEIVEPVRSGGAKALMDEVKLDDDYKDLGDLNCLLDGMAKSKSAPPKEKTTVVKTIPADSAKSAAVEDADDIKMGLIVTNEDASDLTDSDELPPTTGGKQLSTYVFPPYDLLTADKNPKESDYSDELKENAKKLMETLASFNVRIKEINYSRGPTITRYELRPDAGVRVRSISNLVDDIALSLATSGVRIEAPIPGKSAVGVEVPNRHQATVYLRTLIESPTFSETASRLAVCLGMDVAGKPIYFNIDKMPHLLIAGATGMGKSVCINSLIVSILYKAKPDEVKLILVDPKKVEFNIYKEMPHLYVPVVSDPKKAAGVLATAVSEMERRFEMIEELNVRDITNYNRIAETDPEIKPMPRIVIVIDELADLMMTAPDDVETAVCRLAQKARAAGIHLIIGTQRPSVDVITGLIKANIPSRIAFTVASQVDSRTIIDIGGAEKLIGRGDMLFAPVGAAKPMRVQGAFVGEVEVENIVEFLKSHNNTAQYDDEFVKRIEEEAARCGTKKGSAAAAYREDVDGAQVDPKLHEAVELAIETGKISTSLMQRRLGLGYGRAAKVIDQMQELGYVSAADGNKPRKVLITKEQYMEKMINDDV